MDFFILVTGTEQWTTDRSCKARTVGAGREWVSGLLVWYVNYGLEDSMAKDNSELIDVNSDENDRVREA